MEETKDRQNGPSGANSSVEKKRNRKAKDKGQKMKLFKAFWRLVDNGTGVTTDMQKEIAEEAELEGGGGAK